MASPVVPVSAAYPRGMGIEDTLLRADPDSPGAGLFDLPGQTHPVLRQELLNKIHGRLTTRSNTFAVWMTVGYFEVTDRRARPVKLGRELGSDDGTNIRHRFFAVVDRTNLSVDPANPRLQGPRPVFFSYEPVPDANGFDPAAPGSVEAIIPASSFDGQTVRGLYDEGGWTLRTTDQLTIDVGDDQETVNVAIVSFDAKIGARIRFYCTMPHARGCSLTLARSRLGSPGPQPGFHVRSTRYAGVVRYFTQLD